jgi:hypothetical protein
MRRQESLPDGFFVLIDVRGVRLRAPRHVALFTPCTWSRSTAKNIRN